jgi:phosphoribosyl-dephospho-CoA transferase
MYSRHDLVWLTPEGWNQAIGALPDHNGTLRQWQRQDWPAIVRRGEAGQSAGALSLGVAPPPNPDDGSKQRIALRVHREHVARHRRPLALVEALAAAPHNWQPALRALGEAARNVDLRVYGSLALQALTGQAYVTPCSDIDLLFSPASAAELEAGIALLASHATSLPLDGELVFPSGDAVAWKEWAGACTSQARVLVKSIGTVRLALPAALAASLEAA